VDEEIETLIDQEPQESPIPMSRFLLMMATKKAAKAAMKIPRTYLQIHFSG